MNIAHPFMEGNGRSTGIWLDMLLGGKRQNFNIGYFKRLAEVLGLNEKQTQTIFKRVQVWKPKALQLIENSFLTENNKLAYRTLVEERTMLFI